MTDGWLFVFTYGELGAGPVVLGWFATREEVHAHHDHDHPDSTIVALRPGTAEQADRIRARLAPYRLGQNN
jgi:hypothetical protein